MSRDFAHGHKDIVELKEYFDSIKGNEDMKLFRSNRIDWALERAVSAYEKATHEKSGTKSSSRTDLAMQPRQPSNLLLDRLSSIMAISQKPSSTNNKESYPSG